MCYLFDSLEVKQLNKDIFEIIYFVVFIEFNDLVEKDGVYQFYFGFLVSKGEFQYDMWGVELINRWDWVDLKKKIKKNGLRNSLLFVFMFIVFMLQIFGNNECFELYIFNIYICRILLGEYIVVNKYLLKDFIGLGLWNDEMKYRLMVFNGFV